MENVTKASNWIRNVWNNLAEGEAGTVLTYVTLGGSGACKTEGKRNCTEVHSWESSFPVGYGLTILKTWYWYNATEQLCLWWTPRAHAWGGRWQITKGRSPEEPTWWWIGIVDVSINIRSAGLHRETFVCVYVWDVRVSTHAFPCPDSLEGLEAMTLR